MRISTILKAAVADGLIGKNPAEPLELPRRARKEIDPFTLDEANRIIERFYATTHWPSGIYAAMFEFLFFTGLRLSEALALRWESVDLEKRQVHVCRTVALGEVVERTKTGKDRFVLLNDRALHALQLPSVGNQESARSRKRPLSSHLRRTGSTSERPPTSITSGVQP